MTSRQASGGIPSPRPIGCINTTASPNCHSPTASALTRLRPPPPASHPYFLLFTMEAPKPAMTTSSQPQAVQMNAMNPPARQSNQTQECQRKRGPAERLRGGGAGKVRLDS
ncbi:hypothetical protein C8Q80DRAFT_1141579 [Daedaleopsis nitida]|nr:hypothetical protein C8Q80DRAFT_1141579 [Daedaleopsis nitida]